jgi:hypothetical protein
MKSPCKPAPPPYKMSPNDTVEFTVYLIICILCIKRERGQSRVIVNGIIMYTIS